MELKKKTFNCLMRALHRDIGFFVIGLTVIYALSGILLIYRDTDFLKSEKTVEKKLSPDINESELGKVLHIRGFEVQKTEGDVVYFQNGSYNKVTGMVTYTEKGLPSFLEALNSLHKKSSNNTSHLFSVVYGIMLLFLAISSFWMYKPKTKPFKRGISLAGAGFVIALVLLFV